MEQQVFCHLFLGRHVGDADERQHLMGPSGGEERRRELQCVRSDNVVVGQSVDQ